MEVLRLEPDWLLTEQGWKSGWQVQVESGRIVALGPASPGSQRLHGQALLPGMVNAHSHAFQRLLRGRTEWRNPARPSDDFWSWRDLMYRAAMSLSPEQLEVVARLLYLEMIEAGITTVGEFHYLHYQPDGQAFSEPDELALRLAEAARWAGPNLVLLRCAYHRAGFQQEPNPLQVRFLDRHWSDSIEAVKRLASRGISVGLAPHSVRAVPPDWLRPLADYAQKEQLPLHMHVSEQRREIEQCQAETGQRPVEFLRDQGVLGSGFTAVHAIHLEAHEIEALSGSNVCSCPTTERNLGDGIVAADQLRRAGVRFALGTDSQCQIDLLEDARQLDYHLRLKHEQRAVLDEPARHLHQWLWQAASAGGADSLAQPCGLIQAGLRADFVSYDLNHPQLACDDPIWLLSELVWGAPKSAIAQVWVAGRPQLQDGLHPGRQQAVRDYKSLVRELTHG